MAAAPTKVRPNGCAFSITRPTNCRDNSSFRRSNVAAVRTRALELGHPLPFGPMLGQTNPRRISRLHHGPAGCPERMNIRQMKVPNSLIDSPGTKDATAPRLKG